MIVFNQMIYDFDRAPANNSSDFVAVNNENQSFSPVSK